MINLKKSPAPRNDVKRVLFPLLVSLWRYANTNHPGIDFCLHTKAGNTIEVGVTPFMSGGLMVSRTLYRKADPGSAYTDLTKFNLPELVSWTRNAVSLGSVITPGTYEDQGQLLAA